MKNVSSLKSNIRESPKTPGGISKSLLTPCRRVGLSRNWRKGGPSPFVSPLPGSGEPKQEAPLVKRKRDNVDAETSINSNSDITTTPSRNVDLPRRKKSKILPADPEPVSQLTPDDKIGEFHEECTENVTDCNITPESTQKEEEPKVITHTPILKSKSKNSVKNISGEVLNEGEVPKVTSVLKSNNKSKKFNPPLASSNKCNDLPLNPEQNVEPAIKTSPEKVAKLKKKNSTKLEKSKKKSPENLTKECMVVIQKKIFKKTALEIDKNCQSNVEQKSTSQVFFDSDSDDVPLCQLNKKDDDVIDKIITEKPNSPIKDSQNVQIQPRVLTLEEDDDFMETNKIKVHKLEDKTTSTTSLKKMAKKKPKENKKPVHVVKETQPSSQSSEDDDFDFNNKRTILIRKSYDKVTKPFKAKSTGSITKRDIDELRARIEIKKKLLLAKATTEDTGELRELIKKWQKGCQDALSELMDMMRSKFPDKQNMEFSEMLETLKIPTDLVGYDEENDCFHTPDDASIVLAKFKDL